MKNIFKHLIQLINPKNINNNKMSTKTNITNKLLTITPLFLTKESEEYVIEELMKESLVEQKVIPISNKKNR